MSITIVPKSRKIDLANDLVAHLISEMHHLYRENEHIERLLDAGDEYELNPLPGETLEDIVNNLKIVQTLASQPVPMPTAGRDRERHHYGATYQRDDIRLFAQVALALLDPEAMEDNRSDNDETPAVLHAAESARAVCLLRSTS